MKKTFLLFGMLLLCLLVRAEQITIRLNPWTVDWNHAYLYVWYGTSSENYNWTSIDARIVTGQEMTLTEDGWWTYTFEYNSSKTFYVGFSSLQNYSSPTTNHTELYTGSTCFEMLENGTLQTVEYQEFESESVTIRLNPFTIKYDWQTVYLYVWCERGTNYRIYGEYRSLPIVKGERMSIADDGWLTYSFNWLKDKPFYVGVDTVKNEELYSTRHSSYSLYSNSTCLEVGLGSGYLNSANYRKIEAEQVIVRVDPYTTNQNILFVGNQRVSSIYYVTQLHELSMSDDGWWTCSFEVEKDSSYYVGLGSSATSVSTYASTPFNGSVCLSVTSSGSQSLTTTQCLSLTPNESNSFNVHVATPGTFGQMMVQKMGDLNWYEIISLTITGSLNEDDLAYFTRMTNLQQLDMSGTDLTVFGGCKNLDRLNTIVLPSSCKTIQSDACRGCIRLSAINLENVEQIGGYAFYQCNLNKLELSNVLKVNGYAFAYGTSASSYSAYSLTEVSMPKVQSIGQYAFCGNAALVSVTMPVVESIGEYAFASCFALNKVDISNATYLGNYAFYMYNTSSYAPALEEVVLCDALQDIPDYCFYNCKQLTQITLPKALKTIGNNALPSITDTQMPDNVTSVGSGNFDNALSVTIPAKVTSWQSFSDSWRNVYCHVVVPPVFSVFATDNVSNDTLHVPSISLAAYKLHTNWFKFGKVTAMNNAVQDMTINSDFMLLITDGIADNATITLNRGGALNMSAETALKAGSYTQQIACTPLQYNSNSKYVNGSYQYTYSASLPFTGVLYANSVLTVDEVTVRLIPRANQWNFFSLPFDVNMQDITIQTLGKGKEGISQWVIREYSGANRASGNGSTWNNVPDNGVLKAHTGYILYWLVENSDSHDNNRTNSYYDFLYYFNMPSVKNPAMQQMFTTNDATVSLTEYSAEFPQNQSWNLVGNPYPCAYDTRKMNFNAPITTWNGSSYVAYSIEDDSYILRPGEAFFVQAPEGISRIVFNKDGRYASTSWTITQDEYNNHRSAPTRKGANNGERKVFNITLSNADHSDRARLVLNEKASASYELTCDAAKMMSSDPSVPQLFVNDNGLYYAIDERPEQDTYILGASFGVRGTYTIHIDAPVDETRPFLLTDTETDVTTNLSQSDYRFTAEEGMYDARFVLSFAPTMPTGIDDANQLNRPVKALENGHMIIITPQGEKYSVGGQEL